jgi:hypothetical protein
MPRARRRVADKGGHVARIIEAGAAISASARKGAPFSASTHGKP